MEDLSYYKQAMDLVNFMAGTEDTTVDPQDIEILAQEIEATNSTGYDDYDDDHRVEQPADGINIMKLIETSIARYTANIKEYSSGMNPSVMAKDVINNSKNEWYDRASAIIMTTFAKNKNDVEQTLDTEVLKEYNKLTMLIKNKSKMKKLLGTNNDPFLLEGIVVTYDIFTRILLAYVPVKVQTGETLASIINKRSGVVFMKLLDAVKYINSIQGKLGTKIYYKEPLVSEITGKKIDTIKDTKFDFRRNDQDREDNGFRDYNREVIVTAGRESVYETIGGFYETGLEGLTEDYYDEGNEGFFDIFKRKKTAPKNSITEDTQEMIIKELVKINKRIYDKASKIIKSKYDKKAVSNFGLEFLDASNKDIITRCDHHKNMWSSSYIAADNIQWNFAWGRSNQGEPYFDDMVNDIVKVAKEEVPRTIEVDNTQFEIDLSYDDEFLSIKTKEKYVLINDGEFNDGTEGFFDGIKNIFSRKKTSTQSAKHHIDKPFKKCKSEAEKVISEVHKEYKKLCSISKYKDLVKEAEIEINEVNKNSDYASVTFTFNKMLFYLASNDNNSHAETFIDDIEDINNNAKKKLNDIGFANYKDNIIIGSSDHMGVEVDYSLYTFSDSNESEGTEGALDTTKHYLWDVPKEVALRSTLGPKFSKEDLDFLNKELPSIMRDYVRQVNKSPILKENNIKATLPDTMPIDVYKGWIHQGAANREMMIPIAKFTGITSFSLKYKTLTAGGAWKMALERFPGRWKKCMTTVKKVEDGSQMLLIESPGFRTKEIAVESEEYHLSCESIENLIEIRNNNSLLEYSKLIKALAFTTTLFKPLSGYDVENMCKDIDRLFKDTSANVVSLITGLIAKMDVKIIAPINITYKKYSESAEGKSMREQQFMPKEFDKSMEGRMYDSARPKVEEYEDF